MKKNCKLFLIFLILSMTLTAVVEASLGVEEIQNDEENMEFVKRLAGESKVETSVEVSKEFYKDGAENVVLVGYTGEVDALAGTLLANKLEAPLLFTKKDNLLRTTELEMKRLDPENIYIIGGENVISKTVELELEKLYSVKRINGKNRVDTSIKIVKELKEKMNHVFLVKGYGEGLGDALTIATASAKEDIPIFLTKKDQIPKETEKALIDFGVTHITIIGGDQSVSLKVEESLNEKYIVDRVAGDDRGKTSISIAERYFKSSENLLFTCGSSDSDALLAAYVGAKINAPILLCDKEKLSLEMKAYIKKNPLKAFIVGGNLRISDNLFKELENIISLSIKKDNIEEGIITPIEDTNNIEAGIKYPLPKLEEVSEEKPNVDEDKEIDTELGQDKEDNEESKEEDKVVDENKNQVKPQGLKAISPTAENKDDGKITGIDGSMEYRLKGEEEFIDIKDNKKFIDGRTLSGLETGIYQVRFKSKEGFHAGEILEIRVEYISEFTGEFKDGKIIKYNNSLAEVTIPSKVLVDGIEVEVKEIGAKAFRDNSELEKIILPNTLTIIGDEAFQNCVSLKSIEIPDSVTKIGNFAFKTCSELKSVKLGDGLESIPNSAFIDCVKLIEINIPNSIKLIGSSAFQNCIALESIVIPNSVTNMGQYTFKNCKKLKTIELSEALTTIGYSAFESCLVLESIIIPKNITIIETYAFKRCNRLSTIDIPDSEVIINTGVFTDCIGLTSINILNSKTDIRDKAFKNCSQLRSITIAEGVTISENLFDSSTLNSFVNTYNNNGRMKGTYTFKDKVWEREITEVP